MVRGWTLLVLLTPALSGCQWLVHSVDRTTEPRSELVDREILYEKSTSCTPAWLDLDLHDGRLAIAVVGRERGYQHVRDRVRRWEVERCDGSSYLPIVQSGHSLPDNLANVWMWPAWITLHAFEVGPALGIPAAIVTFPAAFIAALAELVTFIPWFIAGHGLGDCDYEIGRRLLEESEVVHDIDWVRRAPVPGAEVEITAGDAGQVCERRISDAAGMIPLSGREIVAWTKGLEGPLRCRLRRPDGEEVTRVIDPGRELSDSSHALDWRPAAGRDAPSLTVTARHDEKGIVLRFENAGPGEAGQVAALLSGAPELQDRAASVGLIPAGGSCEVRVRAARSSSGRVRIELSESLGRVPAPFDFEW